MERASGGRRLSKRAISWSTGTGGGRESSVTSEAILGRGR